MRLSVIVPVYKAEKYLARCVESVLAQTMGDFELILVDDGSPDGSGAMCDDFSKRDARIKVLHQENAGVSAARNAGVAMAQGEYIAFLDSDDWIEPRMYELLLEAADQEDADIVKCGFDRTDGADIHERQNYGGERQCYVGRLIDHWFRKRHILVWNAIYRAELAKKVQYPVGITGGEDDYASFFYLYYGRSMVLLTDYLYNYFINYEGSMANGGERQCYVGRLLDHWFRERHVLVWNAIYRAELAKKVQYPVGITGGEDDYASFFYLYYGRSMVLLTDYLYNYFINDEGSTANADGLRMRVLASEAMWNTIREKGLKLPDGIYEKLKANWAKRWYHYIRDDRSAKLPDGKTMAEVMESLDFRRSLSFRLALLKRRF